MTRQDFQSDYHTDIDHRLFNSIVADLRKRSIIKAVPQGATYAIRLHSDSYKVALGKILDALNADTFEVDWATKHILTDAEEQDQDGLIPFPDQWMLLTCDKKAKPAPSPHTRPSATQVAARDINHFYGAVHGGGIHNVPEGDGNGRWTRWGTIFGGISAVLAVAAIAAAWFFWRYPTP